MQVDDLLPEIWRIHLPYEVRHIRLIYTRDASTNIADGSMRAFHRVLEIESQYVSERKPGESVQHLVCILLKGTELAEDEISKCLW
jgi:hypothetical protein